MIANMGDKAFAKATMKRAKVPVIPGSEGLLQDVKEASKTAAEIGYPVILKATAGGGGKGMRLVQEPAEMERAFTQAQQEALAAFGNSGLYMEKYFTHPRHIEVQILGDEHNNVYALGERECSIQRKHQKLLEESPSPAISEKLRKKMTEAAVRGARSVNYVSAGTIEFLYQDGEFYFMEMNTRIQVEHPVTEAVLGLDLIKEQIRVAAGEKLSPIDPIRDLRGHAIECRINAEDPDQDFRPSPGMITAFHVPGGPGVRVDTHAYAQYVIPPYYDSLIAKLIVHGRDRREAIERMERALEEFIIEGIKTTIPFHQMVMKHPDFIQGNFDTKFLENLKQPRPFEAAA